MSVYINEVGYFCGSSKHASASDCSKITLYKEDGTTVSEYHVTSSSMQDLSLENTGIVDFTEIAEEGNYYFVDDNGNKSCLFTISREPYNKLADASLKMFYFQRCGIALQEKHAGKYTHKACHTANVNYIFDDSESFECCGGWHDAGDFGRYTTAGAVALAHLLYAYRLWPENFNHTINIPESGNGTPDILNECRYELEWMLKMQISDGGVYHKCTSMYHAPFVMPEDDNLPFIVTPVTSMATADFAAVCSLASEIYEPFDKDFSEKLKSAALKAADWLENNPDFLYENPKQCTTGDYGDMTDIDERFWAAAQLYAISRDEKHLKYICRILDMKLDLTGMGWMDVSGLGSLCILSHKDLFPQMIYDQIKCSITDEADRLVSVSEQNAFEVSMHSFNFKWGSNMVLLNGAIVLSIANLLTGHKKYMDTVQYQIDYLLGRNAMDTSYVTGFGDNAFMNPHNRPTYSDGIDDPIPGFVSGGPNINHCDDASKKMIPAGAAPMKCYIDHYGSYSTNEITIYWNSPLVFTLAFLNSHCN